MHVKYELNYKDIHDVAIHYEGSGNPEDLHTLIGVEFWTGTIHHSIGDTGGETGVDKVEVGM